MSTEVEGYKTCIRKSRHGWDWNNLVVLILQQGTSSQIHEKIFIYGHIKCRSISILDCRLYLEGVSTIKQI